MTPCESRMCTTSQYKGRTLLFSHFQYRSAAEKDYPIDCIVHIIVGLTALPLSCPRRIKVNALGKGWMSCSFGLKGKNHKGLGAGSM